MDEKIEETEQKETYRDRVLTAVSKKNLNKSILISFPRPVFKKFSKWSFENASDCYWLAIDKLMSNYEQQLNVGAIIKLLADRDEMLAGEIDELRQRFEGITGKKEEPQKKKTHFGRKEGE